MGCCLCNCVGGCILCSFRWVIFIVNFLNVIFGGTVIFFGIALLARLDIAGLENISEPDLVGAILLVSGLIAVTIAFIGCCGTLKGSPTLMKTYAAILFISCALNLVSGILGLINSNSIASVGIVFGLVQLVAGIFSICLAKSFKKKRLDDMEDVVRRAQRHS
ncbi:tetraspanin-8-like [Cloeon dipterum]|uniref:tetraspanin-8-like n=1 Tax=Cloeon dipterum TaxID=197152 RepID=UPI00321FE9C4